MSIRQLPSLRPLAAAVVREAVAAQHEGDTGRVAAFIRHRTFGWDRREKLRLMTTLAWLSATLAGALPDAEREALLDAIEAL